MRFKLIIITLYRYLNDKYISYSSFEREVNEKKKRKKNIIVFCEIILFVRTIWLKILLFICLFAVRLSLQAFFFFFLLIMKRNNAKRKNTNSLFANLCLITAKKKKKKTYLSERINVQSDVN